MAVLWLVNTEEAERHQGRNPGRWCGAAPDPRCGAPSWIEWRATVGRRNGRPHDVLSGRDVLTRGVTERGRRRYETKYYTKYMRPNFLCDTYICMNLKAHVTQFL
jgi:hypothetical protein